jgi:beta-lactamase regulating signal transducer with metallopeptidase domain
MATIATDGLLLLIHLNLVAGLAIVLVLAMRPPVRRWFGAHQVYLSWLLVPVAVLGGAIPAPEGEGAVGALERAVRATDGWLSAGTNHWVIAGVWAAGVLASAAVVALRYLRFLSQERAGLAGPAIVGVVSPRVVTPADFEVRYTPDECRLVRAHERAHIDRYDARCNAVILAMQCLNWFNPLVHLAARAIRFDQELACDATVMTRLPTERRRYAEALLHSQHGAAASPLGCDWSCAGARLLMTRLTTLMEKRPGERSCELGDMLLAGLWTLVLITAWTAQPPDRRGRAAHTDIVFVQADPHAHGRAPAPGL